MKEKIALTAFLSDSSSDKMSQYDKQKWLFYYPTTVPQTFKIYIRNRFWFTTESDLTAKNLTISSFVQIVFVAHLRFSSVKIKFMQNESMGLLLSSLSVSLYILVFLVVTVVLCCWLVGFWLLLVLFSLFVLFFSSLLVRFGYVVNIKTARFYSQIDSTLLFRICKRKTQMLNDDDNPLLGVRAKSR